CAPSFYKNRLGFGFFISFSKDDLDDPSRQWWVSDGRFSLIRPFYGLRIAPILPEDSGVYRCRLETDPIFQLTMSTAYVELSVMVRPVAPSTPAVKAFSNHSLTLAWKHHTARAHRPISRYSVLVRSVDDDSRFVIPAPSNATTVIIDNLTPNTLYVFAVRAENAAGLSPFGPETRFRTLGEGNALLSCSVFSQFTTLKGSYVLLSFPCLEIKAFIKKKEKCVYLEELSPLVYDSTTCDDIPIELFYGYCEDLARNENAKFKLQFQPVSYQLVDSNGQSTSVDENFVVVFIVLCRYLNIGAIESSRVRINTSSHGSDYINANYIDSCEKRNAYIATQAPLPSTFADFWEMIWQETSNVIVVITNMIEDGRVMAFLRSDNQSLTSFDEQFRNLRRLRFLITTYI
ncbi:unnamed protein product, partial [Angiostrongylus costaricensis]|uniref:Fibronectin type-III domain-containing protein n=1 Tax=Angiostrongylus costaricensis TaxID=334426 RepID=A0A158PJA8_ANGCS